ncbi:uncharacterized protein LOC127247870 [Andrographis paniculata]|uniref:uncharacterized protein LOC127247870 n=1 Tax=Andrographis paniculata TaxID=175694 RepID=UPI0021E94621|nr:uncharacterized protein LOC127247870 [Andrographis paniculata]
MEEIRHEYIKVNGLKLHVAELGTESAPAVVFLHGFPEVWYSWRHQIIPVAKAGFRAIAYDYRGYGESEQPPEPEKATFADFMNDLLALLDARMLVKVFLVAKDFGVRIAYIFAMLHPERVSGIINLGVPFAPPGRTNIPNLPEGCYITRFKEPGRAEADLNRFSCKTVLRRIYILFSRSEVPTADANQEIMDIVDSTTPLPPWLSEQDLDVYASLYDKSSFQTALQVPYRSLQEQFNIENKKVDVPVLVITGEKDFSLKFPGIEDYIKSNKAKAYAPHSKTVYLPEGSHFMQEQFPDKVNQMILTFLRLHSCHR